MYVIKSAQKTETYDNRNRAHNASKFLTSTGMPHKIFHIHDVDDDNMAATITPLAPVEDGDVRFRYFNEPTYFYTEEELRQGSSMHTLTEMSLEHVKDGIYFVFHYHLTAGQFATDSDIELKLVDGELQMMDNQIDTHWTDYMLVYHYIQANYDSYLRGLNVKA